MTATPNAVRQADFKRAMNAMGFVQVNVWVNVGDVEALKRKAASLTRSRARRLAAEVIGG